MPQETRYYVPKLQALKNIISDPGAFGIDLDVIADKPYFATVPVQNIDLRVAAKLAEMPVQDLIALNPGHKRSVLLAANAKTLVLPVDRIGIFKANIAKRTMPLISWKPYQLKRGDTLGQLASQHGISLAGLKRVNGITRQTRVRPGMELLLPTNGTALDTALVPTAYRTVTKMPNQRQTIYVVRRGDTLWRIAQRFDVSMDSLRLWNPPAKLVAGQRLVIHRPAPGLGN
jgi:membrane-bound lytic murein transglycosylase D